MSTMDKWDTEIAPQLRAIELSAKKTGFYARLITVALNKLSSLPSFDTRAQDELEKAQKDLAEAMDEFNAASQKFRTLQAAE